MRFFFDLASKQEVLRDEEGSEAGSLDEALKQARDVLREMAASGELEQVEDGWRLVIRNEAGELCGVIPIGEEELERAAAARRAHG